MYDEWTCKMLEQIESIAEGLNILNTTIHKLGDIVMERVNNAEQDTTHK